MRFGRTVEPGFLPVMSVPTEKDAERLLTFACQTDKQSGEYLARELLEEQTLENLEAFGQRLAERWNYMTAKREAMGMICTVPDCDRPHAAKGLCDAHRRRQRNGSALTGPIQSGPKPVCADPACARLARYVDPLCDAHRARVRLGLKITGAIREQGLTCGEPGCDRPHHARGRCRTHYERQRLGRAITGPIQSYVH